MLCHQDKEQPCPLGSNKRQARRLRAIGLIILFMGAAGAVLTYRFGTRSVLMDDPAMVGFDKAQRWQMGVLFGGMGKLFLLLNDLAETLSQPDTQALLLLAISVIITAGCFHAAKLMD